MLQIPSFHTPVCFSDNFDPELDTCTGILEAEVRGTMKEVRQLDVVLHSATGLKRVSKMAVYCVAWIEPSVRVPSPHTKAHGTHPEFNTTISMPLDERTLGRGQHLNLEILGHGLISTRRVGFVRVSLHDLLQDSSSTGAAARTQFNAHPVMRHSGRQQGFLSFDLHVRPASQAGSRTPAMSRRMTMEPTPSKPEVVTTLRERFEADGGDQSDDTIMSPSSSTSSSEDRHGAHYNNNNNNKEVVSQKRSFSFTGCMSQPSPKQ